MLDLLEREDFEELNKLTESEDVHDTEGATLLCSLRKALAIHKAAETSVETGLGYGVKESESVPVDLMDGFDTDGQLGGHHGLMFNFRRYLDTFRASKQWQSIVERGTCNQCRTSPYEPWITSCFHIFCKPCLEHIEHWNAQKGKDSAQCSACGTFYTSKQPCIGYKEAFAVPDSAHENDDDGDLQPRKKNKQAGEFEDWIGMKGEILPSAKTVAVKAQVLEWLYEDPTAKIIIYSQFIPMIRILIKICNMEGWTHCKYTGTMSHDARAKAIKEFGDGDKMQIMLTSLRAGGQGLNLTMASRVLIIEPW